MPTARISEEGIDEDTLFWKVCRKFLGNIPGGDRFMRLHNRKETKDMGTKDPRGLNPSSKPDMSPTRDQRLGIIARTLCLALVFASFMIVADFVQADWQLLDHPDAVQTNPLAISGNRVVGVYYLEGGGSHGFVYDGTTWANLDYPGALYTDATGISGNKIVGTYYSDPGAQYYHSYIYNGKKWSTLDYPGAVGTHALGINGNTIVGYYWDGEVDHGFIYDGKNWTTVDYPAASGTFVTDVFGGTAIGNCEFAVSEGYLFHGSKFTFLDYPEAKGGLWPWSISGDKVVGAFQTESPGVAHGFIYDLKNSSWTNLDFPGADWTVFRGIDGINTVGFFETKGDTHGFLYTTAPQPWSKSERATGWVTGTSPADGYGVILHTTDGGQTWVRQGGTNDIPNIALNNVKAVNTRTVWVVGDSDSGYGVILRTDDGGKTWVRQGGSDTVPDVDLHGIAAPNKKTAWAVGDKGTILQTRDGGKTWHSQQSGTGATLFEVAAVNADIAWAAGDEDNGYAVVLHTTDGGQTWNRQGTAATLGASAFIDLTAVDVKTAWAVGVDSYVSKTTDGGKSWRLQMGPGLSHNNGVCGVNTTTAWIAADYNVVYRTTDRGKTWVRHDVQVPGNFYLLGVSAWGKDRAWVVGRSIAPADEEGIILNTTDGGDSWHIQTLPVNVPFRRVSFVGSKK